MGIIGAAGLLILDQLGLWMERKGWLYYRHRKPSSGSGVGNALQELNSLMTPAFAMLWKQSKRTLNREMIKEMKNLLKIDDCGSKILAK